MTSEELKNLFGPWRERHLRSAWKPIAGRKGGADALSWFGGAPTGSPGDEWPKCAGCDAPMSFFLQLDLSTLPQIGGFPTKSGILQLFYCSTDDGSCETWAPFSGTHCIRLVQPGAELLSPPEGIPSIAQVVVTGWEEFLDSPHPEDHVQLGRS